MTTLRQRLLDGPVAGLFVQTPHPVAVEVLAGLGPDFVCLDQEHAPLGRESVHALLGAAALAGVPALVRVPGPLPHRIGAALDSGAAGVLVPRIESAASAADVVRWARYPPAGERGFGPGRANGYGRAGVQDAEAPVVAVQVETQAGLDALDAILAVDGLDLVFVGPGDLSVSLGLDGIRDPRLQPVVADVLARVAAAGRWAGVFALDAAAASAWLEGGARLVVVGSDLLFLATGVQEAWRALRR